MVWGRRSGQAAVVVSGGRLRRDAMKDGASGRVIGTPFQKEWCDRRPIATTLIEAYPRPTTNRDDSHRSLPATDDQSRRLS
ncbi:hypothetical protein ACTQ45_10840 [Fundicoccus sp. Sow4_D5]|uniref:hypothetical protein n=1 Tax=Fundicoccus sp. Sow4_D5 TaxID=3438782 RepID=UPI003F933627